MADYKVSDRHPSSVQFCGFTLLRRTCVRALVRQVHLILNFNRISGIIYCEKLFFDSYARVRWKSSKSLNFWYVGGRVQGVVQW